MTIQLTVLILLMSFIMAGFSLRHYAVEGCNDCNCGREDCCEEEVKED